MFISIKFKIHIFYKPTYQLKYIYEYIRLNKIFFNNIYIYIFVLAKTPNTSWYKLVQPKQASTTQYFFGTFWRSIGTDLMACLVYLLGMADENQVVSCHIVTSSVHNTILQHLLYEHCARHLAKCRPVRFAKEKYQSRPRVITNFCGRFEFDFLLLSFLIKELEFIGEHIGT